MTTNICLELTKVFTDNKHKKKFLYIYIIRSFTFLRRLFYYFTHTNDHTRFASKKKPIEEVLFIQSGANRRTVRSYEKYSKKILKTV